MIELSKRMQSVADMIQPCDAVGDIGCDHAFVSIYLIEQHKTGDRIRCQTRTDHDRKTEYRGNEPGGSDRDTYGRRA